MRVLPNVKDWILAYQVYRRFAQRPGSSHIATRRALACLAAVVRQHQSKTVLEYGSGIGTITYLLLKASPYIQVVGIEANAFCLEQLARNIPADLKPRLTLRSREDRQLGRQFDLIVIDGKIGSAQLAAFLRPDAICFIEGDRQSQATDLQQMAEENDLSLELERQFTWIRTLHRKPLRLAPTKTCRIGKLIPRGMRLNSVK